MPARRRSRQPAVVPLTVLAGLTLSVALVAPAATSAAARDASAQAVLNGAVEGTAIAAPGRDPHPVVHLRGGSDEFVGVVRDLADPYADPGSVVDVYRINGGSFVRTLTSNGTLDRGQAAEVLPATAEAPYGTFQMRDLTWGSVSWDHELGESERYVAGYQGYLLVRSPRSGGGEQLRVYRSGGSGFVLNQLFDDAETVTYLRSDADGILVGVGDTAYLVDIWSQSARAVTAARPYTQFRFLLAQDHLYWIQEKVGQPDAIGWFGRYHEELDTTTVEDDDVTRGYYVLGDRLVARYGVTDDDGTTRYEYRPIYLDTGWLESSIVTGDAEHEPVNTVSGRLLLARIDGKVASVDLIGDDRDFPPEPVVSLPTLPGRARSVQLTGDLLAAGFEKDSQRQESLVTNLGGSATWRDTWGAHGARAQGEILQVEGDTVLSRDPAATLRVGWPDGEATLSGLPDPVLGHGGRLLSAQGSGAARKIYDSHTLDLLLTTTGAASLDGPWVWTSSGGVVTGVDTSSVQPTRTVDPGLPCTGHLESVVGRWALLSCSTSSATTDYYAVDLRGGQSPWRVPALSGASAGAGRVLVLGNGSVSETRSIRDDARATATNYVVVRDLTGSGHEARTYGPVGGGTFFPRPFAVGDAASRDLVYVDPEGVVRHVPLDWLGAAPAVPEAWSAPVLVSLTGTPRKALTRQVSVAWSYTDQGEGEDGAPSGVATYDVRYRQANSGQAFGAWQTPSGWQRTTLGTVALQALPGQDTCFQVRARDKEGHVSAWSASRCSSVDGVRPTYDGGMAAQRVVRSVKASTVTWRWTGHDDRVTPTSDVEYRKAAAGKGLGPWTRLRTADPRFAASLTVAAGGQACLRIRLRDGAGNVSGWQTGCAWVPYDDRALNRRSGTVSRGSSSAAIAGTYSKLAPGASVKITGQTGRGVYLVAKAGPTQGKVEIFVGGRSYGRVSLKASTNGWRTISVLDDAFSGKTITVKAVGTRAALVDALAVRR